MRAAVLFEPGRIEVVDRPDPVPGPQDLLVAVRYAGICGTDLALASGAYPAELPLVPGHELAGRVIDAGAEVPEEWRDALVTSEISLSCTTRRVRERCEACRASLPAHCVARTVLGIRGADGVFAERVVVPVGAAHRLPQELDGWAGVLVEPFAAALRTFELSPVEPGETVVVLGAGRLGLLVVRAARSFGARVLAVSRSERKRVLAVGFGAEAAFGPDEADAVCERTDGIGAPLVVECTGAPEGLTDALRFVRPRGTVAVKTTSGLPSGDVPTTDLVVREITVQGSRCGPFDKAIERLRLGQVPVEDYVSGVFPLEEIGAALDAARRAVKIILEVG